MNAFSHVPPGFRFHPTDEELVGYYLPKKVASRKIDLDVIKEVDLYKIEPWDLQELCRIGAEDQSNWYFFSHKDKKYPTGTRTNRATAAGFWKATGRDKAIYSKHDLIGMRKTLVFYKGRAPNGLKSDWIMHEYRMESDENAPPQEEGWVVCRVFKKKPVAGQKLGEHGSPIWYDDSAAAAAAFMSEMESPQNNSYSDITLPYNNYHHSSSSKKEINNNLPYGYFPTDAHFPQLALVESPKMLHTQVGPSSSYSGLNVNHGSSLPSSVSLEDLIFCDNVEAYGNQVTDWRILDKFVASQLSQEQIGEENNAFGAGEDQVLMMNKEEMEVDNCSSSSAGCMADMWK